MTFNQTRSSVTSIFEAYASSDFIISNRLHSLIFAWAHGAIPIALVDERIDRKICDLFNYLGLNNLIFYVSPNHDLKNMFLFATERAATCRQLCHKVFLNQQVSLQKMGFLNFWEKKAII